MQTKNTRTTAHREQGPEEILRYNPLRFVREAYVRFIQGLFYAAPRGYYHWELDPSDSEIIITDENPIKVDTFNKRPAITCTRAPVALYTLGMDDMLSYDMRTGARQKSVLVPGTMSINCISRVPLEAEQLAWIVAENLWMLRDVMRRWGFYDVGRNLAIGSPTPPGSIVRGDSGDELYMVSITSPFQIARISQVTPLGQRMVSSVEAILSGGFGARNGQGDVYYNGADVPYGVDSTPVGAGADEITPIGGRVDSPLGEGSVATHTVKTQAHPLNPTRQVVVRACRPGDPAVRPPMINGRTIPINRAPVEESQLELQLQLHRVKT